MFDRQYKYAIRKTLLGVGSVAVGSLLIGGGVASAEELADHIEEPSAIEIVEPILDDYSATVDPVTDVAPVEDDIIAPVQEVSADDTIETMSDEVEEVAVQEDFTSNEEEIEEDNTIKTNDSMDVASDQLIQEEEDNFDSLDDASDLEDINPDTPQESEVKVSEDNYPSTHTELNETISSESTPSDISTNNTDLHESIHSEKDTTPASDVNEVEEIKDNLVDDPSIQNKYIDDSVTRTQEGDEQVLLYGRGFDFLTYKYSVKTDENGNNVTFDNALLEILYQGTARGDQFNTSKGLNPVYDYDVERDINKITIDLGTLQSGHQESIPVRFIPGSDYSERERSTLFEFNLSSNGEIISEHSELVHSKTPNPEPFVYDYPKIEGTQRSVKGSQTVIYYDNGDYYESPSNKEGIVPTGIQLVYDEYQSKFGISPLGETIYVGVTPESQGSLSGRGFVENRNGEYLFKVSTRLYEKYRNQGNRFTDMQYTPVYEGKEVGDYITTLNYQVYDESLLPVPQVTGTYDLKYSVAPVVKPEVSISMNAFSHVEGYSDHFMLPDVDPEGTINVNGGIYRKTHPFDLPVRLTEFIVSNPIESKTNSQSDFVLDSLTVTSSLKDFAYTLYGSNDQSDWYLVEDDNIQPFNYLKVKFDQQAELRDRDYIDFILTSKTDQSSLELQDKRYDNWLTVSGLDDDTGGFTTAKNNDNARFRMKEYATPNSLGIRNQTVDTPALIYGDTGKSSTLFTGNSFSYADEFEHQDVPVENIYFTIDVDSPALKFIEKSDYFNLEATETGQGIRYTFSDFSSLDVFRNVANSLVYIADLEGLSQVQVEGDTLTTQLTSQLHIKADGLPEGAFKDSQLVNGVYSSNTMSSKVEIAVPKGVRMYNQFLDPSGERHDTTSVSPNQDVTYVFDLQNFVDDNEDGILRDLEINLSLPRTTDGDLALYLNKELELSQDDGLTVLYSVNGVDYVPYEEVGNPNDVGYIKVTSDTPLDARLLSGKLGLTTDETTQVGQMNRVGLSYSYAGFDEPLAMPDRRIVVETPQVNTGVQFVVVTEDGGKRGFEKYETDRYKDMAEYVLGNVAVLVNGETYLLDSDKLFEMYKKNDVIGLNDVLPDDVLKYNDTIQLAYVGDEAFYQNLLDAGVLSFNSPSVDVLDQMMNLDLSVTVDPYINWGVVSYQLRNHHDELLSGDFDNQYLLPSAYMGSLIQRYFDDREISETMTFDEYIHQLDFEDWSDNKQIVYTSHALQGDPDLIPDFIRQSPQGENVSNLVFRDYSKVPEFIAGYGDQFEVADYFSSLDFYHLGVIDQDEAFHRLVEEIMSPQNSEESTYLYIHPETHDTLTLQLDVEDGELVARTPTRNLSKFSLTAEDLASLYPVLTYINQGSYDTLNTNRHDAQYINNLFTMLNNIQNVLEYDAGQPYTNPNAKTSFQEIYNQALTEASDRLVDVVFKDRMEIIELLHPEGYQALSNYSSSRSLEDANQLIQVFMDLRSSRDQEALFYLSYDSDPVSPSATYIRDYDRMKGFNPYEVGRTGSNTIIKDYVRHVNVSDTTVYVIDSNFEIIDQYTVSEDQPYYYGNNELQFLTHSDTYRGLIIDGQAPSTYLDEDGFEWQLSGHWGLSQRRDDNNYSAENLSVMLEQLHANPALAEYEIGSPEWIEAMDDLLQTEHPDLIRIFSNKVIDSSRLQGSGLYDEFISGLQATDYPMVNNPINNNSGERRIVLQYDLAPGGSITTSFESLDGQILQPKETVIEHVSQKTPYTIEEPPATIQGEDGLTYRLVTDLSTIPMSGMVTGQSQHYIFKYAPDDVTREEVEQAERVLPYETTTVSNPNLPEGERRVAQAGVEGLEVTTTTHVYINDQFVRTDTKVTVEKEPVDEIVEVGTGSVSETVTQETINIPYDTERIDDPTLPVGEEVVETKGQVGEKIITTTTPTLNGEPSGDPVVIEEVTKDPVNEVIRVGTGIVSEDVAEETVDIPFDTEYIESSDLPEGEERIVQVGQVGEKVIITTTPTLNGEPSGDPVVEEVVTKDPVNQIIEVGVGTVSEDVQTETVEIAFETEVVYDESLPVGESITEQRGELGEKVITTTTPTLNGEPSGDPVVTEEVTKEPITEIVRVGTGVVAEEVTKETVDIPYETERIDNPELPEGEERVAQVGVAGEKVITTTTPLLNGEPSGDSVVEEAVTKDPVNEIIEVGTGIVSETVTEETVEIPFETEIIDDPSLPTGEQTTTTQGEPGEKVVITTTPTLNGEPSGESVVEEVITKEPTNEVVHIGTGIVSKDITEETVEIPYKTERIDNPSLPEGEVRVTQVGVAGKKVITTTTPLLNGKPSGESVTEETITKDVVNEIIEVGTGIVSEDITEKTVEIPFKTETIDDPTLPIGEQTIATQGQPGEKTIITTTPTLNGEPSGDPVIEESITKEPITEVIRIGTGVVSEDVVTEEEVIEVEVEIIYDEDLPRGTTQVEREGTPGILTTITTTPTFNGEPSGEPVVTQEVTKEMETKVIRIGTGIVPDDQPVMEEKPIVQEEPVEDVPSEPKSTSEKSPQPMTAQASSSSSGDKELPETGESAMTALYGLSSLMAGAGLVGASRRRRKEDE